MNTLLSLWALTQYAYSTMGRTADRQEQREVEAYLSQSKSIAELESRELQWVRSRS